MRSSESFPLLGYAVEKYAAAFRGLAIGQWDVRSRLCHVLPELLMVGATSVPDEMGVREDIEWIHGQLTRLHPTDAAATLRRIQGKTGAKIAERVVTVYEKLQAIAEARHGS